MRRPRPGEALFRLLVRAYPASFRREYGDELMAHFRRDRDEPRHRGLRGGARFWLHTTRDLIRTAASEHRGGGEAPDRGPSGKPTATDRGIRRSFGPRLLSDAGHAFRSLRREPLFTAVAVGTLGLGIGATTVVFSMVSAVLLTPLPLPEPDRLVQVEERDRADPSLRMAAYGNWEDLRRGAPVFEDLALWAYDTKTLTGADAAVRLRSREVSANFLPTLRVAPQIGRTFAADEYVDGQHLVVLLSQRLWREAFGGDPGIVGSAVLLDAEPHVVVGVMPAGFDFPFSADIWVPLLPVTDPLGARRWHRHRMTGRLADGVDIDQAVSATVPVAARLEEQFPEMNAGLYFSAHPLLDEYVGNARGGLRLLFGAVVLVLLIGCVNVAALALARSSSRRRELAVRRALGATRTRLAALVLSESLALGAGGGLLGLLLARWGLESLVAFAGAALPRAEGIRIDAGVFAFAFSASLVAAILVALLPLVRETRTPSVLSARATAGIDLGGGRRFLVVAELAFAVVLVSGAALLGRSMAHLAAAPTGVVSDGVLTLGVSLPNAKYPERIDVARLFGRLLPEIEALPGIESGAVTLTPPVQANGWRNYLTIRGRPLPESELPMASYIVASPGYFDTLGIPLLAGRSFTDADQEAGETVAVINRTAAERFWPGSSPLGEMILGSAENPEQVPWARVIGVVADVPQSLAAATIPEVYVPIAQDRVLSFVMVVKTSGVPLEHAAAVRDAIVAADPDIPVTGILSLDDRLAQGSADVRFSAALMSAFAVVALGLSVIGVYGVLTYTVSQRRREFGVRAAIGATRGRVIGMVLGDAMLLALVAIGIGIAGALALGRTLSALLFEVRPGDPVTLALVSLTVAAATLAASVAPAWRAASVDPVATLRDSG